MTHHEQQLKLLARCLPHQTILCLRMKNGKESLYGLYVSHDEQGVVISTNLTDKDQRFEFAALFEIAFTRTKQSDLVDILNYSLKLAGHLYDSPEAEGEEFDSE